MTNRHLPRAAAALVAAVLAVGGLAACSDGRDCLRGHNESYTKSKKVGARHKTVQRTRYVCDEYAPKPVKR